MSKPVAAQVLLAQAAEAAEVQRAVRAFNALGFECGPVVGGSFSVAADAFVFDTVFGVRLQAGASGGVQVKNVLGRSMGGQLPVSALPGSLRPLVSAVLFTEPPEFGPASY